MSELLGKDFLRCSDKRADLLWAEDWRRRGDPQLLLLLLLLLLMVLVLVTGMDGAVVAILLLLVLVLLIMGTRSVSAGAVVMMARASRAPTADMSLVHVSSLLTMKNMMFDFCSCAEFVAHCSPSFSVLVWDGGELHIYKL